MFIGRKEELKQLNSVYTNEHSNVLVIYGREGIGKTSLALEFCEDKNYIYYKAAEVSEDEQLLRIEARLNSFVADKDKDNKSIIIVDEFQYAAMPAVIKRLADLLSGEEQYGKIMLLLLSSSINWVENSMVTENREFARLITGIIKLREFSFQETVEWFPKTSASDCIIIRALFGGIPKYLTLWQENRRVRENIISLLLTPGAALIDEAEFLLKKELRELGAYNTILTALASGKNKLNEIYAYTGYNRAKISVYIKNLIEMDIVEKIYSFNVKNSENTMKGMYRIKDNFFNFYYAYVFPNLSEIESGSGKQLYAMRIQPDFNRFIRKSFSDVCREYLDLMSKYRKLGKQYNEWNYWFGKNGILDIIGVDSEKNMIVATCQCSDKKIDEKALDEMISLIDEAGIKPDRLCIFAKAGFEKAFEERAKEENIMTVSLSDF